MPTTDSFAAVQFDSPLVLVYEYYSSVTFVLSVLLAPVLFFVILTQSRALGTFKWFVLNHAVWSQLTELVLGFAKPLLLFPHCAGVQLGLLRRVTDSRGSVVILLLLLFFFVNSIAGVAMVLTNRYLAVFPGSLQRLLTHRVILGMAVVCLLPVHAMLLTVFVPFLQDTPRINGNLQSAEELLDVSTEAFLSEPSFFLLPSKAIAFCILTCFILMMLLIVGGAVTAVAFVVRMQSFKQTKSLKGRLQLSLVLCSLAQFANSWIFLSVPLAFLSFVLRFNVQHTAATAPVVLMLFSTAALADSVVTLALVSPYRNYLCSLWRSVLRRQTTVSEFTLTVYSTRSMA